MNAATGSTCDISPLLRFHFWQPVYFKLDDSSFPSDSTEETGRFVGISENVGHYMAFSILITTTNKVINISSVRPAGDPASPNLRLDPLTTPEIVKSRHLPSTLEHSEEASPSAEPNAPDDHAPSSTHPMPILDPNDIVGRIFLIPQEDGQLLRATIVKAIDDYEGNLQRDSSRMKFICSTKDDTVEDVFTYNEILDHINMSEDDDLIEWKFKAITAHEGPLTTSHPN